MKKPKLHKQGKSYSGMAACLKMVLEHYGIREDEKTLRIKSKTKFYGTHPIHVVERAKSYGLDPLDPEDGEIHLDNDLFERLWQNNDYTAIVIEKP